MDKDKNKNGGLDDPDFDADFTDTEFAEDTYDIDATDEDPAFTDEEFGDEDWQEEENGKKNKEKSLYTGGGEKEGMSFNAKVIIGAVILGLGVLGYNIMSETAAVQESQQGIFRSVLNIGGIMDGTIFGDKTEESTPEQKAEQEKSTQEQGFLNNPEALNTPPPASPSDPNAVPPQPTPITPETAVNEPLTPMPGEEQAGTPRAPEDAVSAGLPGEDLLPAAPVGTPPSVDLPKDSAEDIVKQAIENRQRAQNEIPPGDTPPSDEPVNTAPSPVPSIEASPVDQAEQQPATVDLPPVGGPTVSDISPTDKPVETTTAPSAQTANIERKLDELLKRMDQIEGELDKVRDAKDSDFEAIKETVTSLKKDVGSIKSTPSAKTAASSSVGEEPAPAPVKKKKKPAPVVQQQSQAPSYASPPPVTAKASSGRWELRAAQPGRAWISRQGERDMQTVELGQSLPGLGTVTAITYQGGRWTVYGTQGQIVQ